MLSPEQLQAIPYLEPAEFQLWDQRVTVRQWTGLTMQQVIDLSENEFNLHLTRAVAFANTCQLAEYQRQQAMMEAQRNQQVLAEINHNVAVAPGAKGGLQIVRH